MRSRRFMPGGWRGYLRWRRLMKLQKTMKPTTMDPHTAATDNISSFMRRNFPLMTRRDYAAFAHETFSLKLTVTTTFFRRTGETAQA
jgi:hypothetical protein